MMPPVQSLLYNYGARGSSDPTGTTETTLRRILALTLLLAGAVCLPGCSGDDGVKAASGEDPPNAEKKQKKKPATEDEAPKEEAVPVEVVSLERGPIESVLRFSSNLEAESEVQVFSQAQRLVISLLVEEGDRVRKGQTLLRLQDEEQRSALAKARSQLEKAEREYRRVKRLYDQELISREDFTNAVFEVEQQQIAVDDAERELTYTRVAAPISGTITARYVSLGDQVQISEHLFDIVDFGSIVARVFVPEKHLPELATGLAARITAAATGDRAFEGKVDRISPVVDPQSGTVKVTVAVGRQPGMRPGLYVDVDLVVATRDDAVLIPKRAVVYDNDQMFVYRLGEDSRVDKVFVEAALEDRDHVEPVSGLDSGDRVVVAGQAGLKDDALVRVDGERDLASVVEQAAR